MTLKQAKNEKIGFANPDYFKNPASPTEKIFAIVGVDKKYLKLWRENLPDWEILFFPKDKGEDKGYGENRWANSGDYLMLHIIDYRIRDKDSLAFYNKKDN